MTIFAATNNFTINLEAIGILLGILVSITILLSLLIQFANRINKLEHDLQYLRQELIEHSSLEGHKILIDRVIQTNEYTARLERSLELHVQDYINRKEFVQFMLGQLDEKINHKFGRLYNAMKDMQKFLHKSVGFRVREYIEDVEAEAE